MNRNRTNLDYRLRAAALVAVTLTAGCAAGVDSELEAYVAEVTSRPGGRIEPLPQIQPYESFGYKADSIRSPFQPDRAGTTTALTGPKPLQDRSKEYLEQFPLDTLAMVGTLEREGRTFGLLQTQDGMVHRVSPGNFIGQNDGRIVAVDPAEIRVEELVPDGIGGFYPRSAQIALND